MPKTPHQTECALCQPRQADQIYAAEHWRVLVNYNQSKLGKCMAVLKRHAEDVCHLTDDEVCELWNVIRKLKATLCACFQPDHFNYAFLMNQDAHVHLHVIPRYCGRRAFAGVEFHDNETVTQQKLPDSVYRELAGLLREALNKQ